MEEDDVAVERCSLYSHRSAPIVLSSQSEGSMLMIIEMAA